MTEEELEDLKSLADSGDLDAQYRMGNELAVLAGQYRVSQSEALQKTAEKLQSTMDFEEIWKSGLGEISTYRCMMRNAYIYYYMAASQGHQMSMYMLGMELVHGMFMGLKDADKAFEYLSQVDPSVIDDPGFDEATLYSSLARIYEQKGDSDKAFEYSGKAAECGDVVYKYSFAKKSFEAGRFDIAFRLYSRVEEEILADEEDKMCYRISLLPDAAYSLGVMYLEGKGTERNLMEAYNHFDPRLFYDHISQEYRNKFYRSQQDAVMAIAELGQDTSFMIKAAGFCSINNDPIKALDLYEKALRKGDRNVLENLATLLLSKQVGDRRNPARALELLLEVAKKSDSIASIIYPLYETGDDGIAPDPEKAAHWKNVYERWAASSNNGWGPWGR